MKSLVKLLNLGLAFFNKIMDNFRGSQDMETGAEKLANRQMKERLEKIKAANRIDARPDRNRLRRDDGDVAG